MCVYFSGRIFVCVSVPFLRKWVRKQFYDNDKLSVEFQCLYAEILMSNSTKQQNNNGECGMS